VSLMEKAYAKIHGSYFALDGGSLADALVDLTGGVVTKVKLDEDEGKELIQSGSLWTRMMLYCSWGYIMAVVCKVKPSSDDETGPEGLLLNHAYSVLNCRVLEDGSHVIRMHNPWPAGDWQGAWRRESAEWDHPGAHSVGTFPVY
jgi:calpain-15